MARQRSRARRFAYPSLDRTATSFRLLRLWSGPRESIIRCDLFAADIGEWEGQYQAASYVWGDQSGRKHQIIINGQEYFALANLHAFLWTLRDTIGSEESLVLWVDAICIDQDLGPERSHQVSLMSSIYPKAERVIAWLGPEAGPTCDFKRCLDDFLSGRTCPRKYILGNCLSIMGLEYWYRIWTYQELILARDVDLLWGSYWLPWEGVLSLLQSPEIWTVGEQEWVEGEADARKKINEVIEIEKYRRGGQPRCLLTMISDIHQRRCSRSLDRIYGVLAAVNCSHELEKGFPVDYTCTPAQVFVQFVQRCGSRDGIRAIEVGLQALGPELDLESRDTRLLDREHVVSMPRMVSIEVCGLSRARGDAFLLHTESGAFECIRDRSGVAGGLWAAFYENRRALELYRLGNTWMAMILQQMDETEGQVSGQRNMRLLGLCFSPEWSRTGREEDLHRALRHLDRILVPGFLRKTSPFIVENEEGMSMTSNLKTLTKMLSTLAMMGTQVRGPWRRGNEK
ncbi:uncharacterized protein E0L32_012398 [Thyridium curvatum]|uniref:Heterokaryon incompatibility domain-containing protein n=1 Tax=Thyridium curvatum TaxID=1093900 RepID=A0A507BHF9_9PEZI|nr:uncharacterized protein E0L32_012398 [Thyridium curvatum]TPX16769.1 hypothetical protein E0L32_012398 [Thyridium curvatum]